MTFIQTVGPLRAGAFLWFDSWHSTDQTFWRTGSDFCRCGGTPGLQVREVREVFSRGSRRSSNNHSETTLRADDGCALLVRGAAMTRRDRTGCRVG